jgi:hypothetical protein
MIETMPSRRRRNLRKLFVLLACLVSWAAMPVGSTVQAQEVDIETDARLEGYSDKMVLGDSNATLTWLGFAFFSAVALLALFKDAKRTHLD